MMGHWTLRGTGLLCASALCAAMGFAGSAPAATLVADYEFNGNLSSSVAGAPDLVATNPVGTPALPAAFTTGPEPASRRPTRAV
jgi:hypothetical protein